MNDENNISNSISREVSLRSYSEVEQINPKISADMVMSAIECGGRAFIDNGEIKIAWRMMDGSNACLPDEQTFLSQHFSPNNQPHIINLENNQKENAGEITNGDLTYRFVGPEEYSLVDEIRAETFDLTGASHDVYDLINAIGGHVAGIYDNSGSMVGFTTVLPAYDDDLRSAGFLLDMIGVNPNIQNRGVGRFAVKALTLIGKSLNASFLKLTYDPSSIKLTNFYTSLGFQPISFHKNLYGQGYDRFLATLTI